MNRYLKPSLKKISLLFLGLILFSPIFATETLIRLISTSDLHGFIKSYDYYQDQENPQYGLEGLLEEIAMLKESTPHYFLVDVGDTLVGSPLGDFSAETFLTLPEKAQKEYQSPIICALNALDYDVATLGNHEFDYGMPFLEQSYQQANFPIVTSNIITASGETLYEPYVILEKMIEVEKGVMKPIKIGFVSNTPPQTMDLNRHKIAGKVTFEDQLQQIRKTAAAARDAGADLIVALSHSGLSNKEIYEEGMENIVDFLVLEKDIDAVLYGHTHQLYSENVKGDLKSVPIAQPGKWGEALAVIDLKVSYLDGAWRLEESDSYTVSRTKKEIPSSVKQFLEPCFLPVEEALQQSLNSEIASTNRVLNNTFNLLGNDGIYTLLNRSQLAYLQAEIGEDIPLLSAVAPGTSILDPQYFIDIEPGIISKKMIIPAVYPATLSALKMTGDEIKTWLEISASLYNTQDGLERSEGDLERITSGNDLLISNALTYLFYPIFGVEYEIDLTEPSIYNQFGEKIGDGKGRIKALTYQGAPIADTDEFILIASSYAPYFANEMKKNRTFVEIGSPNNKAILLAYLEKNPILDLEVFPHWKLTAPKGIRTQLKLPHYEGKLPKAPDAYAVEYDPSTQILTVDF